MAKQIRASGDEILFEHEWVEALHRLIAKAGEKEVYVQYEFPGGRLVAIGFQPEVNERTIHVPLQRQSASGLANGVLSLLFPEEETAHYRCYQDENGALAVWVDYPHCTHNLLPTLQLAHFWISTNANLPSCSGNELPTM